MDPSFVRWFQNGLFLQMDEKQEKKSYQLRPLVMNDDICWADLY
jgi:hypothetical protein